MSVAATSALITASSLEVFPKDWFSIIGGICGFLGITVSGFLGIVLTGEKKTSRQLRAIVATDGVVIEKHKQRVAEAEARADAYDPYAWLEIARNERKDGNEAKAMDALRAGISRTATPLHEAYLELARHHIALYPDADASIQLQEAGRLAHIASLLKPRNRTALQLVEEIDDIGRMEDIRSGRLDYLDDDFASLDSGRFGGGLGSEATTIVQQLLAVATKLEKEGHFLGYELVAHRARMIALFEFGDAAELIRAARYHWARALVSNGLYAGGLREIESLLSIAERVHGSEHPDTLNTRHLHAQVLDHLGRYQAALTELESLLPIAERVLGSEHPYTLATRELRSQVLDHLGR